MELQDPRDGFVAVGFVLKPWGLRGDLKVESLTDFDERFSAGAHVWLDGSERTIERSRFGNGPVYLKLNGIDTVEAAAGVRGMLLEVPDAERMPLPAGEFYEDDLVGLRVMATDGRDLGVVRELLAPGPNSVLVVDGSLGEVLVPYIDDVVRSVDPGAGRIEIEVIDGLLPDPRPPRPPRFKRHQGRRQRRAAQDGGGAAPSSV